MLFKGRLVKLRSITEDDLKYAAEYLNDPEIILNMQDGIPIPTSLEKQKEWFSEYIKEKPISEGIMFAIEANDGKYIGGCGANNLDMKNRVAEVGIFIGDKDYLGKGYGTEAMGLLLQFLFDEVNMNKVSLNVIAFNKRAVRSYEKAGFKLEATAREATYRFGRYHDLLTMSILKEEYELKRGTSNE